MRWLDSITDAMNMNSLVQTLGDGEGQGSLACFQIMGLQRVRHALATEQQQQQNFYRGLKEQNPVDTLSTCCDSCWGVSPGAGSWSKPTQ